MFSAAPLLTSLTEVQRYLALLFPDPPDDAWLVVSWLAGVDDFRSQWFLVGEHAAICTRITQLAQHYNVYVGMGLRHPQCTPGSGRGTSDDVFAIGGLWIEFDHNGGIHSAKNLPSPGELQQLISTMPFRFSLLIDSGGGIHAYVLFKELWILDTPAEREKAATLLRRFQRTIKLQAGDRGWKVDTTADLARVLRPAGTLNHKGATPKPVMLMDEQPLRYNPSDIEGEPWLVTVEDLAITPSREDGTTFPLARLEPIVTGCAWLSHTYTDAAVLPEPEWYAMLSLVGRCHNGDQRAHEWSQPHPGYSARETDTKLRQALTRSRARVCSSIRDDLNADDYCNACPHWKKINSPIALGLPMAIPSTPHDPFGTGLPTPPPPVGQPLVPVSIPAIHLDTHLTRWTDEGQSAMLKLRDRIDAPYLYQRARSLVIIAHGGKPPKWIRRPPDAPVIIEASDAALYELAGLAATWQKWEKKKKTEGWMDVLPPKLFVSTLMGRPSWPFPPLEGVIHSPTLRPDGSVLDQPGYDVATGLYFDTNGTTFPPLPSDPDIFDVHQALQAFKDILHDFLWGHPYDQIAAIAAIMSLVCRYTIMGNIPLFGITATTRGAGKGLLADVIAIIGTGRGAPLWSQAEDDAEERKRLLTLGMDGDPLVCIDNVTRPLGSGPLDLALTSSTFKDRILSTQTSMEVPMYAIFIATGNNLQYLGDLARRVVPIEIDPAMERPEERANFRYPDLLPQVLRERPRLVIAALTILKAYFIAGCPSQNLVAYGSFQPWSDRIRAALVWAGEPDPCEGRKTITTQDPGHEALAGLLQAWNTCYPAANKKKITLARLKQEIARQKDRGPFPVPNEWDTLEEAIYAFDQGSARAKDLNTRTLGNALKAVKGRVIDSLRLIEAGDFRRAVEWAIQDRQAPAFPLEEFVRVV